MRLDRLLVYLRFAKTRSAACALIDAHSVRCNRQPVRRANAPVRAGDVLTLAACGWWKSPPCPPGAVRPQRRTVTIKRLTLPILTLAILTPLGKKP